MSENYSFSLIIKNEQKEHKKLYRCKCANKDKFEKLLRLHKEASE